jgi:hypothetical protein
MRTRISFAMALMMVCAAAPPGKAEPPVRGRTLPTDLPVTASAGLTDLQPIRRHVRVRPRPPVVVVRPPIVVVRPPVYRPWRPGLRYVYWSSGITIALGSELGWCHVHRYAAGGVTFHKDVRCHRHADWNSASIRYVYVR